MSKLINFNDRSLKINEPTMGGINGALKQCPAIMIEHSGKIEIDGPLMIVDNDIIDLEMYTIGSLVEYLSTQLLINAKIFSTKLTMYPAINLADFCNISYSIVDILNSPTDIRSKSGPIIRNIVSISDLVPEVISLTSNGKNVGFTVNNNKIFTDNPGDQTKAIIKYSALKFFISVQESKVINIKNFCESRKTPLTDKVLDISNSFVKGI